MTETDVFCITLGAVIAWDMFKYLLICTLSKD